MQTRKIGLEIVQRDYTGVRKFYAWVGFLTIVAAICLTIVGTAELIAEANQYVDASLSS